MEFFCKSFSLRSSTSIIDLGGAPETWCLLETSARIILVNRDPKCIKGSNESVVADALACPFRSEGFDLVFSNSLIEHLGTQRHQQAFAAEVRRLSRYGYFIQTPNKWFPIEPHYLAPLVQFAPRKIRPMVTRWMTPWGWFAKPSRAQCVRACEEIRLIDAGEMKRLFPDAEIVRERFLGITKSIIAIWRAKKPPQVT